MDVELAVLYLERTIGSRVYFEIELIKSIVPEIVNPWPHTSQRNITLRKAARGHSVVIRPEHHPVVKPTPQAQTPAFVPSFYKQAVPTAIIERRQCRRRRCGLLLEL